jgi:hypothetical protein
VGGGRLGSVEGKTPGTADCDSIVKGTKGCTTLSNNVAVDTPKDEIEGGERPDKSLETARRGNLTTVKFRVIQCDGRCGAVIAIRTI